MSKFLLLGLDGATFEMLDPMLATGRLPVLARLLGDGVRGVLESTIPPVTCPAWPTMYTGRNPGAHGFTSFRVRQQGSRTYRATKMTDVACPKIWTVLNGEGVRTGIFNVPATHPAEPVDGFMVSGFVTPAGGQEVLQPARFRGDFGRDFPGYDPNSVHEGALFNRRSKRRELIAQVGEALRARQAALEWMLDREPVDFLWVVYEAIDRLSHYGYAFLDPASVRYETEEGREVREAVLDVLAIQDQAIGRILERMGAETAVMVVSDHGFNWTPRLFDLYGWLVSQGLLVPSASLGRRAKGVARRLVTRVLGRSTWVRMQWWRSRRLEQGARETYRGATWDWQRTKAWPGTKMEYGLHIHAGALGDHQAEEGTEPARDALQQRLVRDLAEVTDPETGERVFDTVTPRESLCDGPFLWRMPDVLFLPRRHLMHSNRPLAGASERTGWLAPAPDLVTENHHDRYGVFAGVGGPFGEGAVQGARILDVMPTLLYAMGLPVPKDLEGRPLTDAVEEGYRGAHGIEYRETAAGETTQPAAVDSYSAEEEAEIAKRLEDLGYM